MSEFLPTRILHFPIYFAILRIVKSMPEQKEIRYSKIQIKCIINLMKIIVFFIKIIIITTRNISHSFREITH